MSSTNPARRVLAALATLTVLATGVAAVTTAAGADAVPVARSGASAAAAAAPSAARPARTTVTLKVPHCEGCTISPAQGLWDDDARQGVRSWGGPSLTVHDGEAAFTTATRHLHGLSLVMSAPWERRLGYVTNVVMRYGGHAVGERVSVAEARQQRRGTACWAGTDERAVTLKVIARRARVEGVGGQTTGTLAFVRTTPDWMRPSRRAYRGVMGSQDLNICGLQPER